MKRKDFIKKMNLLSGDDRNTFILCCGLMNNNNIESVNDLMKTLNIKLDENEVISMNKYMFRMKLFCDITGENLFEYLSDEYLNLFKKGMI
jgi:hypothetical protein